MLDLQVIAGEECLVVIPDDVTPRAEWVEAFRRMSVPLLNESGFVQFLEGEPPFSEISVRHRKRWRGRRGK